MNALKPCPFCLTEGDDRLIELWDTFDAGHIAHIHCTHCGSVACANGGGAMSGYWVIHPGCDEAKAAKEKA